MLNNESSEQSSVREFRLQFLERFIRKGLELIVPALCYSTIAHIQSLSSCSSSFGRYEFLINDF